MQSAGVWDALLDRRASAPAGGPSGDEQLEARRVLCGLPASGHELTEDYNPLEANQWDAVSFDKGCYVGQEVVARLRTYDKVSRTIVGLELPAGSALPEKGARLFDEEQAVGEVTSAVEPARPSDRGRPGLRQATGDAGRSRAADRCRGRCGRPRGQAAVSAVTR